MTMHGIAASGLSRGGGIFELYRASRPCGALVSGASARMVTCRQMGEVAPSEQTLSSKVAKGYAQTSSKSIGFSAQVASDDVPQQDRIFAIYNRSAQTPIPRF